MLPTLVHIGPFTLYSFGLMVILGFLAGTALGGKLAKERGYREIRTWNSVTNTGMLAINVELGFARQPAWIQYQRKL